ncbi:hypothetical protein GWI33_008542 [Rhynchophorus ferrugineus]|uniref:Uncharacterized protein n=1 Tax=Rhynchophorus ferrugineus TaxID=354439 RepID=A0A834ME29_RHYFE|nr:hypothetical protein GWI33_008542 [Rhynchophorus ferrugineus]
MKTNLFLPQVYCYGSLKCGGDTWFDEAIRKCHRIGLVEPSPWTDQVEKPNHPRTREPQIIEVTSPGHLVPPRRWSMASGRRDGEERGVGSNGIRQGGGGEVIFYLVVVEDSFNGRVEKGVFFYGDDPDFY